MYNYFGALDILHFPMVPIENEGIFVQIQYRSGSQKFKADTFIAFVTCIGGIILDQMRIVRC